MSDTPKESGIEPQPVSRIQFVGQFIKDLSFEVPHAPEIFNDMRETAPDIPISIDCETRELKENTHEVSINIHVEATIGDKPAFIMEVAYAGIVILGEIPEDHVRPVLLIEVPRQMIPFVRQVVADITVQGGFPPLMLQLIDFMDLYRRKYSTEDELAREARDITTAPDSPSAG